MVGVPAVRVVRIAAFAVGAVALVAFSGTSSASQKRITAPQALGKSLVRVIQYASDGPED